MYVRVCVDVLYSRVLHGSVLGARCSLARVLAASGAVLLAVWPSSSKRLFAVCYMTCIICSLQFAYYS